MTIHSAAVSVRRVAPVSLAALCAVLVLAPAGLSHANGGWAYSPDIQDRLAAAGKKFPICSGRGRYRLTSRSYVNKRHTWQFRHFECVTSNAQLVPAWTVCVHVLRNGSLKLNSRSLAGGYRPCRF